MRGLRLAFAREVPCEGWGARRVQTSVRQLPDEELARLIIGHQVAIAYQTINSIIQVSVPLLPESC